MNDRAKLATAAVERMQEAWSKLELTPLEQRAVSVMRDRPRLEIHWDDCDMDERKFWFHFKCSELDREVAGSGVARLISRAIRVCVAACAELEGPSPYKWEWQRWESPRASYCSVGGRKEFDRYETTAWIYTLTFYGG